MNAQGLGGKALSIGRNLEKSSFCDLLASSVYTLRKQASSPPYVPCPCVQNASMLRSFLPTLSVAIPRPRPKITGYIARGKLSQVVHVAVLDLECSLPEIQTSDTSLPDPSPLGPP